MARATVAIAAQGTLAGALLLACSAWANTGTASHHATTATTHTYTHAAGATDGMLATP